MSSAFVIAVVMIEGSMQDRHRISADDVYRALWRSKHFIQDKESIPVVYIPMSREQFEETGCDWNILAKKDPSA